MSLRLWGTSSGWGRSAGAVIPALGSGRYSPGPNIVLPSWLKGSDPNCTITVFWGQPGALATVSNLSQFVAHKYWGRCCASPRRFSAHLLEIGESQRCLLASMPPNFDLLQTAI